MNVENFGKVVTLGDTPDKKYAATLTNYNNEAVVALFKHSSEGMSRFNDEDFITAIPLVKILKYGNQYISKVINSDNSVQFLI